MSGNGLSSNITAEMMSPLTAVTQANTQYNATAFKSKTSVSFLEGNDIDRNANNYSSKLVVRAQSAEINIENFRNNGVIDENGLENTLCPENENCSVYLAGFSEMLFGNIIDPVKLIHEGDVWSLS